MEEKKRGEVFNKKTHKQESTPHTTNFLQHLDENTTQTRCSGYKHTVTENNGEKRIPDRGEKKGTKPTENWWKKSEKKRKTQRNKGRKKRKRRKLIIMKTNWRQNQTIKQKRKEKRKRTKRKQKKKSIKGQSPRVLLCWR